MRKSVSTSFTRRSLHRDGVVVLASATPRDQYSTAAKSAERTVAENDSPGRLAAFSFS